MFVDISALGARPLLLAISILLVGGFLKFLFEGYKARSRFVELQRQGMVSRRLVVPSALKKRD